MNTVLNIPFQVIDLSTFKRTTQPGETGTVHSQTLQLPGLRIRHVEYSPGYLADHWCVKGHILYCLDGSFTCELKTGEKFELKTGMFYIVSDELSEHRSQTAAGVKLLIIDGDFLKLK